MIGERLSETEVSTTMFQYARAYIGHPPHVYRKIFGLGVATETFLVQHPHAFGKWLARKHWPPISHTIVSAIAERLVFSAPGEISPVRVLQTGVPVLQAMAAVAQVEPFFGRVPRSFEQIYHWCGRSGLDDSRAFVLALVGLEAAITARRRQRDKLATEQTAYSMRVLKRLAGSDPDSQALLPAPIADAQDRLAEEDRKIDSVLSCVVGNWPNAGLTDAMADVVFDMLRPESVELGSRLSEKAAAKPGIDRLRQRIVTEVFSLIGLQDSDDFASSRYLVPDTLPQSCTFAAAHFAVLQMKAGKSLGQQTAVKVGALVARAQAIILAPYAAARGFHYYTAISHEAAALLFAFAMVSEGARLGDDMERLLGHVLDAAEILLRADRAPNPNFPMVDEIARLCVRYMEQSSAQDRRRAWRADASLPVYARALAMWSSGATVDSGEQAASELFLESSRQRYERTPLREIHRATVLLDMGFARAVEEGADSRRTLVKTLWDAATQSWDSKFHDYAKSVVSALEASRAGDEMARGYFLNEQWWQSSLWATYLRTHPAHALLASAGGSAGGPGPV